MKKYTYLVRDLDLLSDDENNLENRLQEFGDNGFKLIATERYVNDTGVYFRCVFIKEFVKNLDKDEIGYEDLFKDDNF